MLFSRPSGYKYFSLHPFSATGEALGGEAEGEVRAATICRFFNTYNITFSTWSLGSNNCCIDLSKVRFIHYLLSILAPGFTAQIPQPIGWAAVPVRLIALSIEEFAFSLFR